MLEKVEQAFSKKKIIVEVQYGFIYFLARHSSQGIQRE
jgi:hypothetical protein